MYKGGGCFVCYHWSGIPEGRTLHSPVFLALFLLMNQVQRSYEVRFRVHETLRLIAAHELLEIMMLTNLMIVYIIS